MFEQISYRIAHSLFQKGIVLEEESEVIAYGLNYIFQTLSYMTIFLVIGIIAGNFLGAVGIILSFFLIRATCGGYHSPSEWQCLLLSILMYLTNIGILFLYHGTYIYHLFFWMSATIILILGPVEHPNKPFYEGQKKELTRKSRAVVALLALLYCLYFMLDLTVLKGLILGSFSASTSLLIAHKIEGRYNHEKNQ